MAQKQKKKFPLKKLIVFGVTLAAVVTLALLERFLPMERLLPSLALPQREGDAVRLHFVDVGQGDCTVVEFPDGALLVVDGGDGGFSSRNHLIRYIKGLHPTSVSLMATHSDIDHYNGLTALLHTFAVEKCYLPLVPSEAEEYGEFLAAVEEEGCETETFTRYDRLTWEGGYLVCLSPRSEEDRADDDVSTVLYLESGGMRALLCGDISERREKFLLSEYTTLSKEIGENVFESDGYTVRLEDIDLLKAAHHGSAYSSCSEWLQLLRPKSFLLSCGRGNSYRHPSGEALSRFRAASPEGKIYRTDELGDIIFTCKDGVAPVVLGGDV